MLRILEDGSESKRNGRLQDLDELAREGARRMLASALDAEATEYVGRHRGERDAAGRAQVVRNGKARSRQVTMGSGTVAISAPHAWVIIVVSVTITGLRLNRSALDGPPP